MIRLLWFWGAWVAAVAPVVAADSGDEHAGAGLAPWVLTVAALVALAIMCGIWLLRRAGGRGPLAGSAVQGGHSQFDPVVLPQYSPQNVGNDASARPWERQVAIDPNSAAADSQVLSVPDGFDAVAFLNDSKANFIGLQSAWDRADTQALRAMMTDAMLADIQGQLAERERTGGRPDTRSEVVMIEAQLLGIEELADCYMASVEFSGLIREGADAGPNPFRELWNVTRPKDGEGRWLVAGVQALH